MGKKKRVRINNLISGMVVADDVYNSTDQLVIARGSTIDDNIISKLEMYDILAVNVFEEEKAVESVASVVTQTEQIKGTDEFKEFENIFAAVTGDLQQCMTNAVANGMTQEDLSSIRTLTRGILEKSMRMPNIFDMLHCMRESADGIFTHSVSVAVIGAVLARWLKFPAKEQELVGFAGMLHDIGKLQIPEEILLKPGKLTEEEFELVKSHTIKGYNYVKNLQIDRHVKQAILMHHERCDGSGYPMKAKGANIDKYAKIIAIADVYVAMTSNRVYRDSICPFEVIDNFEKNGLQLYEIEYIMTFLKNIANTYIHSQVRLSNGMAGEIIMLNNNRLAKPVVKVGEQYIDLCRESELKIEEIL